MAHSSQSKTQQSKKHLENADFDKANKQLSQIDMTNILDETDDIQVAWTKFQDAFLETMEKCIPKGKIPERKNLPWLTKDLTKMMKKKKQNWYFKCATRDAVKYRKMRSKVVTKLREAKNVQTET